MSGLHRSTAPHRSSAFRTAALMLALGGAITFVGCSSAAPELLPPVIVDITDIDGTTIQVAEGNVIDLTGDDETYLDWTADVEDPAIAEFVAGNDDGSAQFNPGIRALSTGQTEVTLDNPTSGDTATFTVEVTAPTN